MARDITGLTDNEWTGTFTPTSDQPIVLDTDVRGGLHYTTDETDCRINDITGQRLQKGMLAYVDAGYTIGSVDFEAGMIYQLTGPENATFSRDSNGDLMITPSGGTARAVAEGDWSLFETAGGGLSLWESGEEYEVGDFVYRAIDTAFDSTTATRTEYFIFAARTAHTASGDPDTGTAGNFPVLGGNDQWRQVGLNAGGQRLLNVGAPSTDDDAANKEYVDRLPHAGGRFEDLSDVDTFTSTATTTSATPVTITGGTPTNADTVASQDGADNTLLNVNIPADSGDFNVVGQHISVFLSTAGGTDTEIIGTLENYNTALADRDLLQIRITADQMRDISARSQVLNTTDFPQWNFGINTITEVRTHTARQDAFLAIHRGAGDNWEVTNDREVAQDSLDTVLDYSENNIKLFQNHAGDIYHLGVQTTAGTGINTWGFRETVSGRAPSTNTRNNFTVNSSGDPVFTIDSASDAANAPELNALHDASAYLGVYVTKSDTTIIPRGFYIGQFTTLGGNAGRADVTLDNFTHADGTAVTNLATLHDDPLVYRDLEFTIYELTEAHIDDVTTWRGEYSSTASYDIGDVVWDADNSQIYVRENEPTSTETEGTFPDTRYWTALSDTQGSSAAHILTSDGGSNININFPTNRADGTSDLLDGDIWINEDTGRVYRYSEADDIWNEVNTTPRDGGEYSISIPDSVITGRRADGASELIYTINGLEADTEGGSDETSANEVFTITVDENLTNTGTATIDGDVEFTITFENNFAYSHSNIYQLYYRYIDRDGNRDREYTLFLSFGSRLGGPIGTTTMTPARTAEFIADAVNSRRSATINTALGASATHAGDTVTITIPATAHQSVLLGQRRLAGVHGDVVASLRSGPANLLNNIEADFTADGDPTANAEPHDIIFSWDSFDQPGVSLSSTWQLATNSFTTTQQFATGLRNAIVDDDLVLRDWTVGAVTASGRDRTITLTNRNIGAASSAIDVNESGDITTTINLEDNLTGVRTVNGSASDRIVVNYSIGGTRYPATGSYTFSLPNLSSTVTTYLLRDEIRSGLDDIFGDDTVTEDDDGRTITRPTTASGERFTTRLSGNDLQVVGPTPTGDLNEEPETFSFTFLPGDNDADVDSSDITLTLVAEPTSTNGNAGTRATFSITVDEDTQTVALRYPDEETSERAIIEETADAIEAQFPTINTRIDSNTGFTVFSDAGIALDVADPTVTAGSILGADLTGNSGDITFSSLVGNISTGISVSIGTVSITGVTGNTAEAFADSFVTQYDAQRGDGTATDGRAERISADGATNPVVRIYGDDAFTTQAVQTIGTTNTINITRNLVATNTLSFTVTERRAANEGFLAGQAVEVTPDVRRNNNGNFLQFNATTDADGNVIDPTVGTWTLAAATGSAASAIQGADGNGNDIDITGTSTGGGRAATLNYVTNHSGANAITADYNTNVVTYDETEGLGLAVTQGFLEQAEAETSRALRNITALNGLPAIQDVTDGGSTTRYFTRQPNSFTIGTRTNPQDGVFVFHRDSEDANTTSGVLEFRLRKNNAPRDGQTAAPSGAGTTVLSREVPIGTRVVNYNGSNVVWSGVVAAWHDSLDYSRTAAGTTFRDYVYGRIHIDYYEGTNTHTIFTAGATDISNNSLDLDFLVGTTANIDNVMGSIRPASDAYPAGHLYLHADGTIDTIQHGEIPPNEVALQDLEGYPHPGELEPRGWLQNNIGYARIPSATQDINLLQHYDRSTAATAQARLDTAWPTGTPGYSATSTAGDYQVLAYATGPESYYVRIVMRKTFFRLNTNSDTTAGVFRYLAADGFGQAADDTTDADFPQGRQVVGGLDDDGQPLWQARVSSYETAPANLGAGAVGWVIITLNGITAVDPATTFDNNATTGLFRGWATAADGTGHDFDFEGQGNATAYRNFRDWMGHGIYLAEEQYETGLAFIEADGDLRSYAINYGPRRAYEIGDTFFTTAEETLTDGTEVVPGENSNRWYRVTTAIPESATDRAWPAGSVIELEAGSDQEDIDRLQAEIDENKAAIQNAISSIAETTWVTNGFQPAKTEIFEDVWPTNFELITTDAGAGQFTVTFNNERVTPGNTFEILADQRRYRRHQATAGSFNLADAMFGAASSVTVPAGRTLYAHIGFRDATPGNNVFTPVTAGTRTGVRVTANPGNALHNGDTNIDHTRSFLAARQVDDETWEFVGAGFPNTVHFNNGSLDFYFFTVADAAVDANATGQTILVSSNTVVPLYETGANLNAIRSDLNDNAAQIVEEVVYLPFGEDHTLVALVQSVPTTNNQDAWGTFYDITLRGEQSDDIALNPNGHLVLREELGATVQITENIINIPNTTSHLYTNSDGEDFYYTVEPLNADGYTYRWDPSGSANFDSIRIPTLTGGAHAPGRLEDIELGPRDTSLNDNAFDGDIVLLTLRNTDPASDSGQYIAQIRPSTVSTGDGTEISAGGYPVFALENIREVSVADETVNNTVKTFAGTSSTTEIAVQHILIQKMIQVAGRIPEAPAPTTQTDYNLRVTADGDASWVADTGSSSSTASNDVTIIENWDDASTQTSYVTGQIVLRSSTGGAGRINQLYRATTDMADNAAIVAAGQPEDDHDGSNWEPFGPQTIRLVSNNFFVGEANPVDSGLGWAAADANGRAMTTLRTSLSDNTITADLYRYQGQDLWFISGVAINDSDTLIAGDGIWTDRIPFASDSTTAFNRGDAWNAFG